MVQTIKLSIPVTNTMEIKNSSKKIQYVGKKQI